MVDKHRTVYGEGEVLNATANLPHLGFESFEMIVDVSDIDIPMGGGLNLNKVTLPGEKVTSLKTSFHQISPAVFAVLHGGTLVTDDGAHLTRGEESETLIDPGTLTYTLNNTPLTDGDVMVYKLDSAGNEEWFSQGIATAQDVYTIAGDLLTFNALNDGDKIYILYAYATATGDKVTIEMDDLPSEAELYCVVKGNIFGDPNTQVGFRIYSAIPKPPSISAPRAGHNAIDVEWSVNSKIDVYFDAV